LPLRRSEKEAVVADMAERLQRAEAIVLADYRGLTVKRLIALRRVLRDCQAEIQVIKNTLVLRAFQEAGLQPPTELLTGPTAVALMYDELSAPTKALLDVTKETELLVIKGGILSGRLTDAASIRALAELPSRPELLAQLLGVLKAPMRQCVTVLNAPLQGFVNVLHARSEQAGG
jgi:large subunit ribosomal protein L10